MTENNSLVAWLGGSDLWEMAEDVGGRTREMVVDGIREPRVPPKGPGPIRTLLAGLPFRRVHLLTDRGDEVSEAFKAWVKTDKTEVTLHKVTLRNPTSYREVYQAAKGVFETVWQARSEKEQMCVHLSPGTPTMAAVSVLLVKTQFPAKLYQTHLGKFWEEDIPFDIYVECLPELLRERDLSLEALAARSPAEIDGFGKIVGKSQVLKLAAGRAARIAMRDVSVLITGESGTGKEEFARAIRNASRRKEKPFIPVNCAAIPEELFESEMFGIKKGTATTVDDRDGFFQAADGGTLFLDEVGELSAVNQGSLLRAIQPVDKKCLCKRRIRKVGTNTEACVDVRIIAATNRNLLAPSDGVPFREDLYFRLATITIQLPSLRERRSDIELLANAFLDDINTAFAEDMGNTSDKNDYKKKTLSASAMRRLREHAWPGNVRELYSVLLNVAAMCIEEEIGARAIDAAIVELPGRDSPGPFSRNRGNDFILTERLKKIRRVFVEDALRETDGNQTAAAELLGVSQEAVSRHVKSYGIQTAARKRGRRR